MRSKLHLFSFIILSFLFTQCQKEAGFIGGPDPVVETPLPITSHLQGNVFNENDQPVAGVTIKVGSKSAITDAKGYFRIMDAALDKRSALVTAELNGYFKAYRSFAATSATNHVEIKLLKRNLSGTIDAVAGGEVSLSNGAKVQLQPNGVVVASTGAAYTGTVNVYASFIDPTSEDINRAVPGSFMANDINNSRVILASYGMMAVELSTPGGEKLQVKTGSVSKLTMPIPASLQASAPATIPLWFVDEQTGIWKEEGSAAKSGSTYVGDVKHFTYWNCDLPYATTPINFTLKNSSGQPLPYSYVRIVRASAPSLGMVHGYTDSSGSASPLVPLNQNLVLTVYDPCHAVIHTQNIGPFTQATNVGDITIANTVLSSVTITGTLQNCAGGAVTNGYAIITYNNIVRYASVGTNGAFTLSFIKCGSGPATATILGVDVNNAQQGAIQTITLSQATTSIGNYSACGVSASQFVNYTLDGTSYSILDLATDSLAAWTQPQGTVSNTYISGFSLTGNKQLSFRFNVPNQAPGTYPITDLWVNNFSSPNPAISVNLTNFPLNTSEFYEGNFSGSFTDSLGVSHTISSNFRVRRMF